MAAEAQALFLERVTPRWRLCLTLVFLTATAAAAAEFPNASQPQLAATTDGQVWLTFGRGQEIFVARSVDAGATFDTPMRVAALPSLMLGRRRGPRIAAHGDTITVTAMAGELFSFCSKNAGKTWTGPVRVNDVPGSAREGLNGLAIAPDGRLFTLWLDLRGERTQLFSAESADGGATWSANRLVYRAPPGNTVCECCHPSAQFNARGDLAVMWRNAIDGVRNMWSAVRPAGATAFGAPAQIGEGTWPLKACPMDGGAIVTDRETFRSVWMRAGDVYFCTPGASEEKVSVGGQPVAAFVGETLVLAWQQGADLWVLRKSGASAPPVRHAAKARFPSLIALPDGRGAVLAYEQTNVQGGTTTVVDRL